MDRWMFVVFCVQWSTSWCSLAESRRTCSHWTLVIRCVLCRPSASRSAALTANWPANEQHQATVILFSSVIPRNISTGCCFKNDPTPKMWLPSNSWKFLCQILYTCLAEFCPLMCCFSLKLLCVYYFGIMPNFKFEFCICTSLFSTWCGQNLTQTFSGVTK